LASVAKNYFSGKLADRLWFTDSGRSSTFRLSGHLLTLPLPILFFVALSLKYFFDYSTVGIYDEFQLKKLLNTLGC
jgi:hypothetical protein